MAKKSTKTDFTLQHINAIADRVAIIDLEGIIREVNQAMLAFHQRRRDEIVGRNFLDLVAGDDRERIRQCFKDTLKRGTSSALEYRSLTPAGTETFSEVNARLFHDEAGQPLGAVAVIRDVSQRKAVELQLAEKEEMYRNLLNNISEALFKIDENGIIRFVSAGVEQVAGLKPEEVIGRSFSEFIFPDDLEFVMNEFRLLAQNVMQPSEYRIVNKNGGFRWISSTSRPVFHDNQFRGINGVLIDIHERKLAQQALQDQQELLQQAQKMEAIGTLASGIAHDFNNLLMGIQGRTSLLLMESEAGQPTLEHLKGIEGCIKSAAALTQQLLGLARGGKYEVVPTDLNFLIRTSVDMFGRTRKEIRISTRLAPELNMVEVDRTQIEQVLLNLLVNAWQAMPEGGEIAIVTENIDLPASDARVFHVAPGRFVRVTVSDSGIGMDEKTRSRVFDPFFTTKEMGRGTGLGLASAYGIVKNHGGIISVTSDPGRGSTFHIYLPASEKNIELDREATEDVPGGSETILLIDDEEMVLDVARQLLDNLGYHVLSASNGEAALDLYRSQHERIDLVILDMIMPQMSGGRVFDELKKINPGVRVLLSSGYSINGQAMDILARGCRGFIQKPFTVRDLALKLRDVLTP